MWKQFYNDFNRQDIYIDSKLCTSVEEFEIYIEPLKTNKYVGLVCELLATLLCNQSSFCLPFQILHDIYHSDKNNISIVSSDPLQNLLIRTSIYITINMLSIVFILRTTLYIINTDTSEIISIINTEINIDIPKTNTNTT